MKKYEIKNILQVVYNGVDRPFSVLTDDKIEWDFYYQYGCMRCYQTSFNYPPGLGELNKKFKSKLKIWTNVISDFEIKKKGYIKIDKIKHLDKILYALNGYNF